MLSSSNHESSLSSYSDNLLVHYRFDETGGNVIYDSVGIHHGNLMGNFTFSGCTSSGILGQGLSLNGSSDRIIIPATSGLAPSGNLMTITAWVYPYSLDFAQVVVNTTMYIGDADEDTNTVNNLHGILDELRLYDRAFSEAELRTMAQLYDQL